MQVKALVDSGATSTFINKSVVREHHLVTEKLAQAYGVLNVDGTPKKAGQITKTVKAYLEIGEHKTKERMFMTDLGRKDMIIGYDQLHRHNPEIDWQTGEWRFTRCPESCVPRARKNIRVTQEEVDELETPETLSWIGLLDEIGQDGPDNPYINWISTENPDDLHLAQIIADLSDKADQGFEDDDDDEQDSIDWQKLVPKHLWDYGDVFSRRKAERMPIRKPYDHAIEFEGGASLPKPAKLYTLSPLEKQSLDEWLDEELRKGYIRKSKCPLAAPVFFVKKKDGKLRLVQDYRKLNAVTIKNRYPIPRITDLIDSLSQAKIFTKIDLRWGYNNVCIKQGDEWKIFEKDCIEYLGMIISHGHVEMDPAKLTGVTDWPRPEKVKQVQAFLGFANFYRRFIQDFAKHAKPLTILTQKEQPWIWTDAQEQAFQSLKQAFTSAPILRIPDDVNPFRLECDSSDFATGAVLSQLDPNDNMYHPVAFYSKSLNVHERNYEIYDKELLAIIRSLEEYRQHLEGHPQPVEIWSDHQNLTYFRNAQKLSRRQARWSLYLTRFNFELKHKPGKTMLTADPLSRRPDHEEGVNFDNSEQILLKPEFFAINAIDNSHDSPINDERILREVKEALMQDDVTKDYHDLLKSGPREFGKSLEDWNYENGLLLYRGKIYIPKSQDNELRRQIIHMHHDIPSARHPSRWKTYELITQNYWWPGLTTDVKKYCQGCDICQRMKNRPQQPYGPLIPNPIPGKPWDIMTCDLITQLPESHGYNTICVVVVRLTKRAHFYPITNKFSAVDLARLLYERVWTIEVYNSQQKYSRNGVNCSV